MFQSMIISTLFIELLCYPDYLFPLFWGFVLLNFAEICIKSWVGTGFWTGFDFDFDFDFDFLEIEYLI